MYDALIRLKKALLDMRRGQTDGRSKPHKPVMLLAVLDLFDTVGVTRNRIYYDDQLIDRFRLYFEVVADSHDWCQPAPPFFHLRSSYFWHHQPLPGREDAYASMKTSGGGSTRIRNNIAYAYLDEEVFKLVADKEMRHEIRRFIIDEFFGQDDKKRLRELVSHRIVQ